MWVIRFLNGPLAGQIINLKEGSNVIGRSASNDVVLAQPGVSKRHCKIDVLQNEILLVDLESRNGTFVNGTKVKSHRLQMNDKISFYNVLAEVLAMPHQANNRQKQVSMQGNTALKIEPQNQNFPQDHQQPDAQQQEQVAIKSKPKEGVAGAIEWAQVYLDEVILPGIYKLTEWTEFRNVVLIFLGAFVFLVTSLSTIPLVRILKSSIEKESQRRALTIARVVATVNRPILMKGAEAAVSVQFAQTETGVEKAYVVSSMDRRIIAPASMAGNLPRDKFVTTAIQTDKEQVGQIDGGTIGAVVPIKFYNPNTGSQSTMAFSVVIYDMGALAIDDGRTISLFIQTLFIALLVGFIIFYFLYRLFEYPVANINKQINSALRDGTNVIQLNFKQESIQRLASNLSSILTRIDSSAGQNEAGPVEHDRSHEMANIVQLIGFPALSVQAHDLSVAAVNSSFEEKTGINAHDLVYGQIENISDQSLKLSVEDLIGRMKQQPDQMATNELEFGGIKHDIVGQAVYGGSEVAYFLVVILPLAEEEEAL